VIGYFLNSIIGIGRRFCAAEIVAVHIGENSRGGSSGYIGNGAAV
jgi:hypothetical protein